MLDIFLFFFLLQMLFADASPAISLAHKPLTLRPKKKKTDSDNQPQAFAYTHCYFSLITLEVFLKRIAFGKVQ